MTHVPNSVAQGMLRGITDPKLRETYGSILNGDFPFRVHCMEPGTLPGAKSPAHKAGLLVGYIDARGVCIEEVTLNKQNQPIAGIETSRDRFDGRKGFRCHCGNWSIQAEEEQPVLAKYSVPVPPTKQDLEDIALNLQKSKKVTGMVFVGGKMEYDGFMIEQVAA